MIRRRTVALTVAIGLMLTVPSVWADQRKALADNEPSNVAWVWLNTFYEVVKDDVIGLQGHAEQLLRAMAVSTARPWKRCTQGATQRERVGTHPLFPFTLRAFVRWSRRNRTLALFSEMC